MTARNATTKPKTPQKIAAAPVPKVHIPRKTAAARTKARDIAPRTVAVTTDTTAVPRTIETSAGRTVDWKNKPISEISLANITPQTLIAPNFMAYELTRSELADRRGIDNLFPSDKELRAAIHLAREVLQPIRDALGKFTPNSVFRGNPLERALKNKPATWISTSQHARGEACDIEIVGMSTLELATWAKVNLKAFDQIICECYDPKKGPNSGWVHISLKAPDSGENRKQLLSYIADNGKMVYVPGLVADVA